MTSVIRNRRHRTFWTLTAVALLGFLFKHFPPPYHAWFQSYGAGLTYVMFWILLLFWWRSSKRSVFWIPPFVLAVTCSLEALQLWHPPFLETVRATYLGHALIGSEFSWWDFPHYFLGSILGWLCIRNIAR